VFTDDERTQLIKFGDDHHWNLSKGHIEPLISRYRLKHKLTATTDQILRMLKNEKAKRKRAAPPEPEPELLYVSDHDDGGGDETKVDPYATPKAAVKREDEDGAQRPTKKQRTNGDDGKTAIPPAPAPASITGDDDDIDIATVKVCSLFFSL